MAFRDLDEFVVVKPIVLPIAGKRYSFPGEVSARTWLMMQRISEQLQRAQRAAARGETLDPDEEAVSDEDESSLMKEVMAGVQDEMVADGCTSTHVKTAFYTLIAYHMAGQAAAEAVWNAQGEAPAPNREERRSKTPAKSTRSRGSRATSTDPPTEETPEPGPTSSSDGS
jgi:hypothetical protein